MENKGEKKATGRHTTSIRNDKWTFGVEITFRNNLLSNWKWKLLKIIYQKRDALVGRPTEHLADIACSGVCSSSFHVREKKIMLNSALRWKKKPREKTRSRKTNLCPIGAIHSANVTDVSSIEFHTSENQMYVHAMSNACPTCLGAFDFRCLRVFFFFLVFLFRLRFGRATR